MRRVPDPAFRLLDINVNLQEMGQRFHRTHPPTHNLTTFTQLLSDVHYPMPKVPALSPPSQPKLTGKLGADSSVVLMGGGRG